MWWLGDGLLFYPHYDGFVSPAKKKNGEFLQRNSTCQPLVGAHMEELEHGRTHLAAAVHGVL